jgi:hypothetical protein
VDQRAADELAADAAESHRQAVRRERTCPVGAGVGEAEDREHLRCHQRGGQTLDDPRPDQHFGVRRDAAGQRGEGEQLEARREHPAAPVVVAEASAENQPGRERQPVAGDDPLDRGGRRRQVALHRRDGDVHDEEVESDHEGAGQDHRQREPAPPGRG